MSTNLRALMCAIAALGQLACAETIGGPRAGTIDLDIVVPGLARTLSGAGATAQALLVPYEDDGTGTTPEPTSELPAEFQAAPSIIDQWSDASFLNGYAWGKAQMRYFASHAKQRVKLTLTVNSTSISAAEAESEQGDWFPATRDLTTETQARVEKQCGHVAEVRSQHTAFHRFPILGNLTEWGHTVRASYDDAQQGACPPESGDTGGGGGGPAWYVCYCIDYYSSATGEWVHGGIIYCAGA